MFKLLNFFIKLNALLGVIFDILYNKSPTPPFSLTHRYFKIDITYELEIP